MKRLKKERSYKCIARRKGTNKGCQDTEVSKSGKAASWVAEKVRERNTIAENQKRNLAVKDRQMGVLVVKVLERQWEGMGKKPLILLFFFLISIWHPPNGQIQWQANWLNSQDDVDLRGASGDRWHGKGIWSDLGKVKKYIGVGCEITLDNNCNPHSIYIFSTLLFYDAHLKYTQIY